MTISLITALTGPTQPADPADAAGAPQLDSPATIIAAYARQADELAAYLERALADETRHHGHPDTVKTLRLAAAALGEQHGQLEELADALRNAEHHGVLAPLQQFLRGYPDRPDVDAAERGGRADR